MKTNRRNLYFGLGAIVALFCAQPVKATNVTVSNMASLQTELAGSSDTIYISPSASEYTITSVFTINRNVCIIGQPSGGNEVVIRTTGNFRHFSYNGAYNLELKDLILIGTNVNYTGGIFFPITPTVGGGGVFAQNGSLKITNCKIAGCQSPANGGAIESNTNSLTVNNSEFQYNNAIGHGGSIFTDAALTLENTTIRNNKAGFNSDSQTVSQTGSGGAIVAGNACTLKGSIILEDNEAYGDGGAIFKAAPGNFNLSGLTSFIVKNNATYTGDGGGICTHAALTLDNSAGIMTISPNTAGRSGGFIYAYADLILKDLAFIDNKAGYNPVNSAVSAPGAGGAVVAGGSLFLQGNMTFNGNKTYGDGGAIYKNATGVLDVSGITSLTIQNNATYTGQGGGICTYVALTLDNTSNNLVLTPNTAGAHGGAIASFAPLVLKNNITISGCKAGYDPNTGSVSIGGSGGAIAAHNALTLGGDVVFENNQAYGEGGAILKGATGNFDITGITNLTVKNNATYVGQGGGICTYAALTLDNTSNNLVLTPNTAGAHGGAIAAISSLTLKNITISNCKAGYNPNTASISLLGSGGAVIAHNTLTLEGDVAFQNNQAYTDGGAIFKAAAGSFDVTGITSLTIKDNATYAERGGGICTYAALTLDNTADNLVLCPNTAGSHGGAIAAFAPLILKNIAISNCKAGYNPGTASLSQPGQGGAIYTSSQVICYGDIAFENNMAYSDGGAICLQPLANLDAATYITAFIAKNNKTSTGRGGAIAAFGTAQTVMNISNATFDTNTSQHVGGAIYAYGQVSVSYSTFNNNRSITNGGGIYKDPSASFPLDIKRCTFSNNSAPNGGGIYTAQASGNTISNSTFSQNTATINGGAFLSSTNDASVNMLLNTFNGNTATAGTPAIYLANAAGKSLNGNVIYGNGSRPEINLTSGVPGSYNIIRGTASPFSGTGNIAVGANRIQEIFTDFLAGDLATLKDNGGPTQTLNILRNGLAYNFVPQNESWLSGIDHDQTGSARIRGCNVDAGSVELQVTDPATSKWTGAGSTDDWNDPANWENRDDIGALIAGAAIPSACTNVIIPGNSTTYPTLQKAGAILSSDKAYAQAACDTIDFEFGGEIARTDYLQYNGAKVHLDVNTMRWYGLSAPLRDMYSGDYMFERANPLTEIRLFNTESPQSGNTFADWTLPFTNTNVKLDPGVGYSVRVGRVYYGSVTDAGADPGSKALISDISWVFPQSKMLFNFYDEVSKKLTSKTEEIPAGGRDYGSRFAYEETMNGDILVEIPTNRTTEGQDVVVGNPLMSHIDFEQFYQENKDIITSSFKTLANNGTSFPTYSQFVDGYTSTEGIESNSIDPMQAFIVTTKPGYNGIPAKLKITKEMSITAPGSPLRSSSKEPDVVRITASKDSYLSEAAVVISESAKNGFSIEEDTRRMLIQGVNTSPSVFTVVDGMYLDINRMNEFPESLPIGISTSAKGMTRIHINGLSSFNKQFSFLDVKAGTMPIHGDSFEYSFDNTEGNQIGRFYLLSSENDNSTPASLDRYDAGNIYAYAKNNEVYVVSSNGDDIKNVMIYDLTGKMILQQHFTGSSHVIIPVVTMNSIVIVKVNTSKTTKTFKLNL